MQRMGFLKYIVYKCSLQDSIGISELGMDLISKVTKKYSNYLTPELKEYITKKLIDRVYKNLRDSVKEVDIDENPDQKFPFELQDQYLSSKEIISKTGKLIYDDWKKYPYLVSSMGFVRKGSYSLLVRGKLLLEFVKKSELDAFNRYDQQYNPLKLSTEQKIIILFSLIDNDGDVLKQLYDELIKINYSFTDRQAGDFLPEIYRNVVREYNSKARTGEEKDKLFRLLRSADTIEKWKDRPYTGKGAREKSITVRVEPFVDLDLLTKSDPYRYEYRFTPGGQSFFKSLSDSSDLETFLKYSFFESINQSHQYSADLASDNEILKSLYAAYDRIKSTLGYAPIKEISLMSAIQSFINHKKYFEIGRATQLISKYQKENPYKLRFQVDRSGAPVYVKFLQAIDV